MKTRIRGQYLSSVGLTLAALAALVAVIAGEARAQGTRTSVSGIQSVTEHIRDRLQRGKRVERLHHKRKRKIRSADQ